MAKTSLDFMELNPTSVKKGLMELSPDFLAGNHKDIMTRGGDFYAIWDAERGVWSTDENDVIRLIDDELRKYRLNHADDFGDTALVVKYMKYCKTGVLDNFHKYVQKQLRENATPLDGKLMFSNMVPTREDYSSKSLDYPLEEAECPAWNELLETLYAPTERHKIEWAIGAIVTGASKRIQKFLVMYGPPGTGKSTVINIIDRLFKGYCKPFDAAKLASRNGSFPLADVCTNPLVAYQHDGDLSRIEDNTLLNSLVSHEALSTDVKYKQPFVQKYHTFFIMGTNKPVKITDAKSGLLRRLIDVHPTGQKIPEDRYEYLLSQIEFELSGIAWQCKKVYEANPKAYSRYVPSLMMNATNPFYNFILDNWDKFDDGNDMTLEVAYENYNMWCEKAHMEFSLNQMKFKEELKNYYKEFIEQEGKRHNIYRGFISDKFLSKMTVPAPQKEVSHEDESISYEWIVLKKQHSLLDDVLKDCPAQLTKKKNGDDIPITSWELATTTLKDIDTSQLHYTKMDDIHHIFIDFDKKDEEGRKSLELNLKAASKWPKTYVELSKGGQGLHLHYIYSGDPTRLCKIFEPEVEIKVIKGDLTTRRKLSLCNDIPIAKISSGLPIKEDFEKVKNFEGLKNERALRTLINNCVHKEYEDKIPSTKQHMMLIKDATDNAYNSGMHYDIMDLFKTVHDFALTSTNNAGYCLDLMSQIHWKSKEAAEPLDDSETEDKPIVFYDVEIFPNLFIICWKLIGQKYPFTMINPSPEEVYEWLHKGYRLVGFNNRDYDNHMVWARSMKYTIGQLYKLSHDIINGPKGTNARIREAYNLSYTDIYDYSSKKQSLKKWEIELGIHHQELGYHWDKPVPEDKWMEVAGYCCNDVNATEAVWFRTQGDFKAREMLVALCHAFGCPACVNDKTNTLTQRIIFGNEKRPQIDFNWRDVSKPVTYICEEEETYLKERFPEMMARPFEGPLGPSILPYWAEYEHVWGTEETENGTKAKRRLNMYKSYNVGRGGLVMANWGAYGPVWTFDVASMHPSSIEAEWHFGKHTKRFSEIKLARVLIKHKNYEAAKQLLGGVLAPFLDNEKDAKMVAQALKIAINAVYGLTSASFDNPFKDPRNENNIVALRGALFMFDLKCAVEELGYTVVHIKTDSIKVANPDKAIYDFIMDYGKRYGYTFEIEHKFEKLCLVNNAVYIGKLALDDEEWIDECKKTIRDAHDVKVANIIDAYNNGNGDEKLYSIAMNHPEQIDVIEGEDYILPTRWTATGTQFAVPFVFKTLFSDEHITFEDLCCTFSTQTALYLDTNEELDDPTEKEKELDTIDKIIKKAKDALVTGMELTDDMEISFKRQTYCIGDLMRRREELVEAISHNHEYHFVGKVGQFVPMKPGSGGGWLKRQQDDKFNTVGGTDGFRWMEAEMVKNLGLENQVDLSYFDILVNDALEAIGQYEDPEIFCS